MTPQLSLLQNQPHHLDRLPVEERLIISIYDRTCNWPQSYIDAGYPVMPWDYDYEGDIFNGFSWLLGRIEEAIEYGYIPYGLLAAPPCTAIASVGAKHWPKKDQPRDDYPGFNGKGHFNCEKQEAEAAVAIAWELKAQIEDMICGPLKFWALENPRGRMDEIAPYLKPYRKMKFDPSEFGDPYNKETWLWGEFNSDLVKNPVPVIENKVDRKQGTASIDLYYGIEKLKFADMAKFRNRTPKGFAKAFFNANQ